MGSRQVRLSFEATLPGFERAFGALQAELDQDALDAGARYAVELVFEEIVANIVRHGAPAGAPPADVDVSVEVGGDAIVMTFDDGGVPFNPVGRPDPRKPTSIEDTPIGGLGLMMVRKAASDMRYERTVAQRNRLTVTLPTAPTRAAG